MKTLYLRWILANALGEIFGLGGTFAVGVLFFVYNGEASSTAMILFSFVVAVVSGVIEATVVGLAQHWAMRPWFPQVERRAWWLGTLVGAELAYVLGYLPSTLMSLGQAAGPAQAAPMQEPAQWLVLLLAAGMGAAGGALLSFAQYLALRGKVSRAGRWIIANMLAWACGMPLIFWAIDAAQKTGSIPVGVLLMAAALLVTGAVVGAIHGAFLVRMAKETRSSTSSRS